MSANRIRRYVTANRISGAMAACCVVTVNPAVALPASQPWQLQVYEAATLAARRQVMARRRVERYSESDYRLN